MKESKVEEFQNSFVLSENALDMCELIRWDGVIVRKESKKRKRRTETKTSRFKRRNKMRENIGLFKAKGNKFDNKLGE